jgi:hypothetical protein
MTVFSNTSAIAEAGVGIVTHAIKTKMRWIYRPQTDSDIGIDGEIEIANAGQSSTGILIKVQIKSSENINLKRKISVPIDRSHLKYWQKLQLPVILLLVDTVAEKAYWVPITNDLIVPPDQNTVSISASAQSELVASKDAIKEWAESAPSGVIPALLELASLEAEDFNDHHFDIDDLNFSRSELVAREIVGMARRLDSLVEGVISDDDRIKIREVEKKIFEPRIAAISKSLESASDETAQGDISTSYGYDEARGLWTLSVSGSISKGNDDTSDNYEPIWETIAESWSFKDVEELIKFAQGELSEIKAEWDEDRRRREGYEDPEPE